MAIQNLLIMNLLRLITPEEIGEIATKHNGGKFLSLTDLVSERVEHNILRDFSSVESTDQIHEEHQNNKQAKILPFKKPEIINDIVQNVDDSEERVNLAEIANAVLDVANGERVDPANVEVVHKENENMSSFILIEKARLKRSQQILKQKEIIDLYQKNSNVDVEQIKGSNNNPEQAKDAGVLVNKKHY